MSELKVNSIKGVGASDAAITVNNTDGTCTANLSNRQNRNLIINGAMQVAQRGTSSTVNDYGTVDRFELNYGGTDEAPTQSQVDVASGTTPYTLGFRKAYKATNGNQTSGAGTGDYMFMRTRFEAQDIANSGWNYLSSSSYITLSFWVKCSVAQTFPIRMSTSDGTLQNYSFQYTISSADTWQKVTHSIPGNSNLTFDNNANLGLTLFWDLFRGTDFTDNSFTNNAWAAFSSSSRSKDQTSTWYTTNDATFEITGVQLEVGSVATDFEHRSFGQELALCQRYYYVFADARDSGSTTQLATGFAYHSGQVEATIHYPVMRAAPSLVQGTGTNYFKAINGNNSDTFNSFHSLFQASPRVGLLFQQTLSGLTAGQAYRIHFQGDAAYIHLSAEL